jgi:hypothetical protein
VRITTRRGFFGQVAAAFVAAQWPWRATPVVSDGILRYKGKPFVFDEHCANNRLIFYGTMGAHDSTRNPRIWWTPLT